MGQRGIVIIVVIALVATASVARAQHHRHHGQDAAAPSPLATQLASTDPAQVRTAIEGIALSGTAEGVAPLAARIEKGLPPDLLDAALEALTVLSRPEAGPVLLELASHRRPAVRAKAVSALVACHARGADGALTAALSDTDGTVRSAAALGLGQLGARSAVDELFLAFEKGVVEAATSIGQLASDADVPRLLTYLGHVPFDTVTPAFDELFARRDIQERTKLDLVAHLAELATPQAKTYLETLASSLPASDPGALRRTAMEAASRINAP